MRHFTKLSASIAVGLALASIAGAQNPVNLPTVKVNADATHRLVGIVTDTSGMPIPNAEVAVGALKKRVLTRADGSFLFDSVPKGKYSVRARKIGYAPQSQEIKVDSLGGRLDNFELVPITQLLPAVVTAVGELGLRGIVADTAFNGLPEVTVKVLGQGKDATTDSTGHFYIPLFKPGSYMISLKKESYGERLVSITIPSDSGRRVTLSLGAPRKLSHREANNVADLAFRIAWEPSGSHQILTREFLQRAGIEWVQDGVDKGATLYGIVDRLDRDCYATVDGGPSMTKIQDVTVDDIESVEIVGPSQLHGAGRGVVATGVPGTRPVGLVSKEKTMIPPSGQTIGLTNYKETALANRGKRCLMVNIWSRR